MGSRRTFVQIDPSRRFSSETMIYAAIISLMVKRIQTSQVCSFAKALHLRSPLAVRFASSRSWSIPKKIAGEAQEAAREGFSFGVQQLCHDELTRIKGTRQKELKIFLRLGVLSS
jgi:hypothetical protein